MTQKTKDDCIYINSKRAFDNKKCHGCERSFCRTYAVLRYKSIYDELESLPPPKYWDGWNYSWGTMIVLVLAFPLYLLLEILK